MDPSQPALLLDDLDSRAEMFVAKHACDASLPEGAIRNLQDPARPSRDGAYLLSCILPG